jgi:hypothetical protein
MDENGLIYTTQNLANDLSGLDSFHMSYIQLVWLNSDDLASGGELLELRLLDTQLLDTFGRKSTARHVL